MERIIDIILSHGAARAAPVRIGSVMAHATDRMRDRFARLPFPPTHAVIAVFPGKPEISAAGGDYSENEARLRLACEVLSGTYPGRRFYGSGNAYPLPAVQAARLAGLGAVGVNGLLAVPGLGSALTIGAVLTDLPLPDGAPLGERDGYCEGCGLCVKSCPTGALTYENGVRGFEQEKCLSHLRQKAGVPLSRPGYFGCDICQGCCPNASK